MLRWGTPLIAHSTDRVPTLSSRKGGEDKTWIRDQVRLERQQGSLLRVFIYMGTGSESESQTWSSK